MQFQGELQEPFTYSLIIMIILGVIILFSILFYLFEEKILAIIKKNTLPYIKKRYLKKLDDLLNDINNNKIDNREAYQKLSNIGRGFIKAATNIDVLTITLMEAKKMEINHLADLMEECYPPEFAKQSNGQIVESINNARRIIQEWA